jgi:hypothetical protein
MTTAGHSSSTRLMVFVRFNCRSRRVMSGITHTWIILDLWVQGKRCFHRRRILLGRLQAPHWGVATVVAVRLPRALGLWGRARAAKQPEMRAIAPRRATRKAPSPRKNKRVRLRNYQDEEGNFQKKKKNHQNQRSISSRPLQNENVHLQSRSRFPTLG